MYKFLSFCFLVVLLSACGVDTSSSPLESKNDSDYTDGGAGGDNGGSTDDNSSNGSNGGDSSGGSTTIDSDFDTNGAIFDSNACNANFYRIVRDASYDGAQVGENGSSFMTVADSGLQIRSENLEGDTANSDKTWVTLYYKAFPDTKHLNLQGYTSHLMDGVFYLSYDIAWSDESISGIDNTVYVKSMKGVKPSCYRLVLNNVIGTKIDVQKVYR